MDETTARLCSGCSETLPLAAFPDRGRRCLECRRAGQRDHYRRNKEYYVQKAKRRNAQVIVETRVWVHAYLAAHPCVDCGNPDVRVLEFDHREREAKSAEVSSLARDGYGIERVRREIELCDVRCANCHRIRTWSRSQERSHDSPSSSGATQLTLFVD